MEPRTWVALAMLVVAVWSDLRWRRVPNRYWFPFLVATGAFVVQDLATADDATLRLYAIAAILCVLFRVLYALRAFGGADAKALMLLAFLVPMAPYGIPVVLASVLAGSVAIVAFPVAFAVANLARGHARVPALFVGFPMPISAARRWKVWPMQDIAPDGGMLWRYWRLIGLDAEAALDRLEAAGHRVVWVTPKLPYLAFVLVGLAWTQIADPVGEALRLLGIDS